MAIEAPIALSVISRMANAEISTAAFQPLMALALWIESPVIDLLTTATTLGKDRQHYHQLSRFVLKVMLWVTVVHTLVAATPLYWVVTEQIIGLKPAIAETARTGLILMIPWSAFIGWRRYLQGLMIRNGQTRLIGFGTAVRMTTMGVVAGTLYFLSNLESIPIVAAALVCGVGAEAAFAHWASRRTIQNDLDFDDPTLKPLTQKSIFKFHVPLTLTTMVTLLGQPLVSAALARSPSSTLALASFQVASAIIWLHRTVVFALPEVVITLYRDEQSMEKLRRFCIYIGFATTAVMAFTAFTNLDSFIFKRVLGETNEDVVHMAHLALKLSCFLPMIGALQSYLRGTLAAHHLTVSRLTAIAISMVCLIGMLILGVALQWEGVVTSSVALTTAMLAELVVLGRAWQAGQAKLAIA